MGFFFLSIKDLYTLELFIEFLYYLSYYELYNSYIYNLEISKHLFSYYFTFTGFFFLLIKDLYMIE